MISICIPIYNGDVRALTTALKNQADKLAVDYEILLIDDASDAGCKKLNASLSELPHIRYKELSENIGRSAIRNMLAWEAKYRYLIFMDCDAQVCSPDFIQNYLPHCHPDIVCYGGIKNLPDCPSPEYYLRWRFGFHREQTDVKKLSTIRNFRTFNFLIDKEILLIHPFDENLVRYGHEDTLFGIRLSEHKINVIHICNPLIHDGLDTSDEFIKKTEQGIQNLIMIQKRLGYNHRFTSEVRLLATERKINSYKLTLIVSFFFKIGHKLMLRNLLGKRPNLFIFDMYKLGYLCRLRTKQGV